MGRGLKESRIRELGLVLWNAKTVNPTADEKFISEFGGEGRGEKLHGRLIVPLWSPRGRLLGFEARTWGTQMTTKLVSQYRLPEAKWQPVFLGMTPANMDKIWSGASVWVGEGLFDMGALEHVVPEQDVTLGTLTAKLSYHHVQFFRRFVTGTVNMVYDNDETGRKHTLGYVDAKTGKRRLGALDVLNRVGVKCRDATYRGGKDPGEIWERFGTDGLRRSFTVAI